MAKQIEHMLGLLVLLLLPMFNSVILILIWHWAKKMLNATTLRVAEAEKRGAEAWRSDLATELAVAHRRNDELIRQNTDLLTQMVQLIPPYSQKVEVKSPHGPAGGSG